MLKEENLAEKSITVGAIKVLGSMEGSGFQKIKESVDLLQEKMNTIRIKQDDYWSGLSADGIISRLEKKTLKKEYEAIDTVHTALMNQAKAKGVENTDEVKAYDRAFKDLHDYLFVELKLFDNMEEDTEIESSEVFNGYYTRYYYALQNAQNRVNIGDPGTIRVLNSLQDLGVDGEVALYENNFYMYDIENHEWIGISVASKLGEYMGVLTESPPQVLNQYFLVGPEGIHTDTLDFVFDATHRDVFQDENGEIIYINYGFESGYIYYWSENNEFVKVEDKNNWRYIIALNDMIACEYEISPELLAWLKVTLKNEIAGELEEDVLDHAPKYLGQVKAVPENPHNGDWFIWATTSTNRFFKGHVYVYEKATVRWIELDPTDTDGKVQDMFMTALNDILTVNPTEVGYFSTVFSLAFYSNTAVINKIRSSAIELEDTGYIRSKGFVSGSRGWSITGDGHAEFSDISINYGYATEEEVQDLNTKVNDTITRVDVEYALGDSPTEAPVSGWETLAPAWQEGKYMWQRTAFTKNGETSYSAVTCISGATGQTGEGGRYVTQFIEQYYLSTSNKECTGGSWQTTQPELTNEKYIWTRTKMTWSDGSEDTYTDPVFAGALDQLYANSISTVDVEYALSNSPTAAPVTGWSTIAPAWEDGKYMWQRTRIIKNGSTSYTDATNISGAKGETGENGDEIESLREQYYSSISAIECTGGKWVYDQPELTKDRYVWTRTEITWESGDVTYTAEIYAASINQLYQSSISAVDVQYALSDSPTVAPTTKWQTTAPAWEDGKYMWQRTLIIKNGVQSVTAATCIAGAKGQTGAPGQNGEDGDSVKTFTEQYYLSTSKTAVSGGTWTNSVPKLTAGKYIWTRTKMVWESGATTYTDAIFAAALDQLYTSSISQVDVEYALGDSPTVAPTTKWQTTAPAWEDGKYMWQRTKIIKNGQLYTTATTCISGAKGQTGDPGKDGEDGADGEDGKYVSEYREMYALGDSATVAPTTGWVYDAPILEDNKYIWTKTEMHYSDGTGPIYTDPVYVAYLQGIIDGSVEFKDLHGEILQEASDPDGWAIRTKDFDPNSSTAGFGIRKNGNVFANNGVFRGTIYASEGEFNGIVKIGSQKEEGGFIGGTFIGDGHISTNVGLFNSSLAINDKAYFDREALHLKIPLCMSAMSYPIRNSNTPIFEEIERRLFPKYPDDQVYLPLHGYVKFNYRSGSNLITDEIDLYGGYYTDRNFNQITLIGKNSNGTAAILINTVAPHFYINNGNQYEINITSMYAVSLIDKFHY